MQPTVATATTTIHTNQKTIATSIEVESLFSLEPLAGIKSLSSVFAFELVWVYVRGIHTTQLHTLCHLENLLNYTRT